MEIKVRADDFITFDGYPDDRDLWTPIAVQRRQMGQRTRGNEGSDRLRNCHGSSSSCSQADYHKPVLRAGNQSRLALSGDSLSSEDRGERRHVRVLGLQEPV